MRKITITKKDLDKDNYYKEDGIGTYSEYENVSVEIESNLGWVRFKNGIYVKGSVTALAGSGIEAGWGIKAGWGIEAGSGITSLHSYIKSKLAITFNAKCTLSAGIFSISGEQEIEAQEIEGGKVIYGKVKFLPKEEKIKTPSLKGKEVEVKLDGVTYKAIIQ